MYITIFRTLMCIVLVLLLCIQSLCMVLSPDSQKDGNSCSSKTFSYRGKFQSHSYHFQGYVW